MQHKVIPRIIFLCTVLTLAAVSARGQHRLEVTSFRLSNGMTVWVNVDPSQPKVYGAVVVKAGAKDCPNSGIAHYLEHLLFKGTEHIGTTDYAAEKPWLDSISAQYDRLARTTDAQARLSIQQHINALSIQAAQYAIPNEFSNLISLYGGTGLNAYTSFDETVFHNTFSPQYLRQWCELNAERLRDPVFRLFQGELETVYEEKNMYADNLLAATAEKAQQQALAGTPYAFPILGATDSLKNPRLSEMMRFFRTYYVPENMGLMLVGDIRTDSLQTLLEHTFGRLAPYGEPMPARQKTVLQNFRGKPALRLKVPIPIVKIGGYVWQAPRDDSPDYLPFKVMTRLLLNSDGTGLIDSLHTAGKLFFSRGTGYAFKDFSAWGFGFVPNLPFGSRKKAEQRCLEQIDRLKRGDFPQAALDAEKLNLSRDMAMAMETVNGRSSAMINAYSHHLTWDDVVEQSKRVAQVSRDDIMRVAREYLNDESLKIVKKFGRYAKEHISQPGYKPVKPKHAGEKSEYARQLMAEPVQEVEPHLIALDSLQRDTADGATTTQLSSLAHLYTVRNPMNDVFSLQVIFRRGSDNDRRLAVLADYLGEIGTTRHSKRQFAQLLRSQGATLTAKASAQSMTLTLTGIESRFDEAISLLHEFLTCPQADAKRMKHLIKAAKMDKATFFKENWQIALAAIQKVSRGNDAPYISHLTPQEMKAIGSDNLVSLFKDLQQWQTDIVYCGTKDAKEIEKSVRRCINIADIRHAHEPVRSSLQPVTENTVYIYDNPSARQTAVGCYQQTPAMPTSADRARMALWGNYFGGGMQSVTFQEIREFRALAYYAHGSLLLPELKTQPDAPCGYVTLAGTQADKAMETTLLIDSLLDNMPVNETNVAPARQNIINSINNSYPAFRNLGRTVSDLRLTGYDHDPNGDLAEALKGMQITDVKDFYTHNIQHRPKAFIIVGNKKYLDMNKLAKLGRIVKLKKKDIYR